MAAGSLKLARCLEDFLKAMGAQERFAIVGGIAVSARTVPRFTAVLGIAVAVESDAAAEGVVYRLSNAGFRPEVILERAEHSQLATARLRQTTKTPLIDLLFATCGIEREVVDAAEVLTVLGHDLHVACTGHLIAMKLLSRDDKRRPMDRQDLVHLVAVADSQEWDRAETAVRLIERRGFARSRDLRAALSSWRTDRENA